METQLIREFLSLSNVSNLSTDHDDDSHLRAVRFGFQEQVMTLFAIVVRLGRPAQVTRSMDVVVTESPWNSNRLLFLTSALKT